MNYYIQVFSNWYKSLKVVKANGGPANGTLAASLVVLERLKSDFSTDFSLHIADGGMQIKGASGKAVADILRRFGETRPFAREGGRTNRGGPAEIKQMLNTLRELDLEGLEHGVRVDILSGMQLYIVERIKDFHNRERLKVHYDPSLSTWQILTNILEETRQMGKAGPVAQHLVGAKLEIRFPHITIQNESFSTADAPTDRAGDFIVGDTVFHITVSPMSGVYEKSRLNIQNGFRVYLLVPDNKLAAARQLATEVCNGKIAVESIESFVSQNIEELGRFNKLATQNQFAQLLRTYNKRVNDIEIDKSLLFELPHSLIIE